MKKINRKSLLKVILVLLLVVPNVFGLNIDASTTKPVSSYVSLSSKSSVNPGEKFELSFSGPASGNYQISVSGGTTSLSNVFIEFGRSSYGPIMITPASGATKVVITATAKDVLLDENYDISLTGSISRTVTVTVPTAPKPPTTPTTPKPPTKPTPEVPKEPEVVKSTDNTLKSLSISEGTLSPEFSADVLEYNVLLDESKTALTVKAEANDSKTTVSNAGEHKLEVGENVITVKTTPESGSEGAYKINVYVEAEPKVSVKPFGEDEDYKVIEHFVGAEIPDSFSEMKFKINDQEVVGLYSELWNTYLVYLSDKDNNRTFYIANAVDGSENYTIGSIFQVVSIYGEDFMILDVSEEDQKRVNMTYTDVEVADLTLKGFKYDNEKLSNFSVIHVRNVKGEDNYYQYEEGNDVYQLYTDNIAMSESDFTTLIGEKDKQAKYMWFGIGALGVVSVSLAGILVTLIIKNKKTKVIN